MLAVALLMSLASERLHGASTLNVGGDIEGRSGPATGIRINLFPGQAMPVHLPAGMYVVSYGGNLRVYDEFTAPRISVASDGYGSSFRIFLGGQATIDSGVTGSASARAETTVVFGPRDSDRHDDDIDSLIGGQSAQAQAYASSLGTWPLYADEQGNPVWVPTMVTASAATAVSGYADANVISLAFTLQGETFKDDPSSGWSALAFGDARMVVVFTLPAPVDAMILVGGPGNNWGQSPALPDQMIPAPPGGCEWQPTYVFNSVSSGGWFVLPASGSAIRFEALAPTRFTAISDFPTGQFWVDVAGENHGPFTQGQSFSFAGLPDGGVTSFSVRSDAGPIPEMSAFQLAMDAASGSFQAKIVGPADVRVDLERLSLGLPPSADSPQFVARGETVRFAARVPGNCAKTYQWLRNSVPIPGETGATLTLTSLTPEQCGAFSVVVQNELGTAESPALTIQPLLYTLTVNAPGGTVERTPDEAGYEPGAVVTLQAQAEPGQVFAGWDGDVHSTANPLEVTINRNTTVNAWFGRPFGGTPRNVPGLIQAEDFDEGGEGVGYHDLDAENLGGSNYRMTGVDVLDWSGGKRVGWNASGEWLHYTVNVASAGWYRAVLRTSSGTSGGTAQLRFSSGQLSDPIVVPGTGSWEAMVYTASAPFVLPAGIQVVQLDIAQAGFDVDSFELVPVQSTPFGGTPWPVPGVIQAEDFDEGGEGSAYHDVDATNLGGSPYRSEGVDILSWAGGERIGWSANGEWLHYTIEIPSAGVYRAVLKAASGGSGGTARLRFSGGQQSDLMVVPGTGAWDAIVNITSAPFTLPAGVQVMRFDFVQAGFDLDSIELQAVTPLNNPPVANAGGPYTVNQGMSLDLDGSGSTDPDVASGDALAFAWDLNDDGTFGDFTGASAAFSPAQLTVFGLGVGTHSIHLRVTDSQGASSTASTTLTILPHLNSAPVANAQSLTTAEDTGVAIALSGADADFDPLSFAIVSGPVHGSLSGTPPDLAYTPAADYNGPDSFVFKVNDGKVDSAAATVSIAVTPVNDPPAGISDAYTTDEDTLLFVGVPGLLGNDTDADDGSKPRFEFAGWVWPPNNDADFLYGERFTGFYEIDPTGTSHDHPDGTLNLEYICANASWEIVFPGTGYLFRGAGSIIDVGNNTAFGDRYVATFYNGGNVGTPLPSDRQFSLAQMDLFDGLADGADLLTDDSIQATSIPLGLSRNKGGRFLFMDNSQPSLIFDQLVGSKSVTKVNGNAAGVGSEVVLASGAKLRVNANGSFSYDPNGQFERLLAGSTTTESFTYEISDRAGATATATTSITILGLNDPPLATAQSLTTAEDSPAGITLTGSDPDGDGLTFVVVSGPSHGTLTGTPPNLTYTPATNYAGLDSFTFKVNDGVTDSAVTTIALTVTPVNDPPVGLADSYIGREDTVLVIPAPGVLANDIDVDGDALTALLISAPRKGTVTLDPSGSLIYTPAANFNGSDSFTYRPRDGTVNGSAATVNITVAPVNDLPVADAGPDQLAALKKGKAIVTLDGGGSTDPDGDALTYRWTLGATVLGSARKTSANFTTAGVYAITLAVSDPSGATATDQIVITVR